MMLDLIARNEQQNRNLRMGSSLLLCTLLLNWGQPITAEDRAASVDLLTQMVSEGVALTPEKRFALPRPDLAAITGEPISPGEAKKILDKIAGRHGDRFTRDSVVAPISVKTSSINNDEGKRIGHFIDVVFVVHQSVAEIRKSESLEDFKTKSGETQSIELAEDENADEIEKNTSRSLTTEELESFGVRLDDDSESLGYLQLPILSKVVVRGVARARRSVWSDDDENAPVILTWMMDSRFASLNSGQNSPNPDENSITNQWRPIERTKTGEKFLGTPQPYAGLGGYVAITSVPEMPEASVIQIRFVLHEPKDWFGGRNLLRSKLPILVQDRVRNLRRELVKSSK